jgi:cytochrome c551/c552
MRCPVAPLREFFQAFIGSVQREGTYYGPAIVYVRDRGSCDEHPHPSAREKDEAAISRGKEIFEQCSGCHSAETDEKKVGPSLKGLFQRAKLRNGKAITEKSIRARIDQGGDGMLSSIIRRGPLRSSNLAHLRC